MVAKNQLLILLAKSGSHRTIKIMPKDAPVMAAVQCLCFIQISSADLEIFGIVK
jgi:hypothetical protein